MMNIKIVNNVPKRYFLMDREIRLEYVSVFTTCGLIIPIVYYSNKQICSYAYNEMNINRDKLLLKVNNMMRIIEYKIEELENMRYKIKSISIVDNLHTHPIGIKNFSKKDYEGVLKPDWHKQHVGSNMLFGFDGKLYQAVLRTKKGNKYEYKNIKTAKIKGFKPYIFIDKKDFLIK